MNECITMFQNINKQYPTFKMCLLYHDCEIKNNDKILFKVSGDNNYVINQTKLYLSGVLLGLSLKNK